MVLYCNLHTVYFMFFILFLILCTLFILKFLSYLCMIPKNCSIGIILNFGMYDIPFCIRYKYDAKFGMLLRTHRFILFLHYFILLSLL